MNPIIVNSVPPFRSLHVQRLEDGFVCMLPPAEPTVARLSCEVATAVHVLFLGEPERSDRSSARPSEDAGVEFDWPKATCPVGSVFQVTKVSRVDSRRGHGRGFMMTLSAGGVTRQRVAINRAEVMDSLREWIASTVQGCSRIDVGCQFREMVGGAALTPDTLGAFMLTVTHASRVTEPFGGASYVAVSVNPDFAAGLRDESVVSHVLSELGGDLEGAFLARICDGDRLEIGPRVEEEDDDDGE